MRVGETTAFTVARENVLSRLGASLGVPDIQIGDAAFDEVYRVNGQNAELIRGLLCVPDVRGFIVALFAAQGSIALAVRSDQTMTFRTKRRGDDVAEIEAAARLGAKLAQLLDAHQDATPVKAPLGAGIALPAFQSVGGKAVRRCAWARRTVIEPRPQRGTRRRAVGPYRATEECRIIPTP